ncbi:MAG: hypothetical protein ACI4EO_07310 [Blautia sp.]
MFKKKVISFLVVLVLLLSIPYQVAGAVEDDGNDFSRAVPYEGIEYDENGHILSPDELNADLPESTYNETLALLEEEENQENCEYENESKEIEYHSEEEEAIDISDLVTIESSDDINAFSEMDKIEGATEFYSYYKSEDESDEQVSEISDQFNNVRYYGTITSNKDKIVITIHVLEKALTSCSYTFLIIMTNL